MWKKRDLSRLFAGASVLLPAACVNTGYQSAGGGSPASVYTIRQGESLYAIAWRYGLDYKEVANWNDIGPPYTIYPGQRIRLNPSTSVARAETAPASTSRSSPALFPSPSAPPPSVARTSPAPAEPHLRTVPLPPPVATPPTTAQTASSGWRWPVQGELIARFTPDGNGSKGIDIAGRAGQRVQAASGGEVVYSGGGLVGYGQLIIIKHDQNFLSAYAHNQALLVKEGEQVAAGQTIAELGSTGTVRPMLHFEIREDGQPVDPLQYLPSL
ncbi:MAG: peptidoglycan DD-metalloendopeptidase family protein [Gammaproteobacteria bacterium]|nr:peptidoglycan DD-metalloendopeptidase family protein [Gammaproteobacteria bacterium]MBA3732478.1 peptidoglycan DD-metalloendopeptidase family protein [Gammaproteobacteria bacterium]